MMATPCSIEGCSNPKLARGYCGKHYYRWRVHGDANFCDWTLDGEPMAWLEAHIGHVGPDCLTWPFATQKGYGVVRVDGKNLPATRIMCERANGPPPSPSYDSAHSCGKGHLGCIHPGHLLWKTHAANLADKVEHGTDNRGEKQWNAKLSATDVLLIRKELAAGASCKVLGDRFRVTDGCISRISKRQTWAWLEPAQC